MKFFRENSYDIVKLFINQIGITIFSFMLYTAVAMIDNDSLFLKINVFVSVFAIAFYFSLLYLPCSEQFLGHSRCSVNIH